MKYYGYHNTFVMTRGSRALVVDLICETIERVPTVNLDIANDHIECSKKKFEDAFTRVVRKHLSFVDPKYRQRRRYYHNTP